MATVNHTGAQLKRYSYDTWGQRRGTDWSIPGHTPSSISGFTGFTSNLPIQISQTRGFTGHEHVDNAGLIHMNGRIYDPVLGRFMSADPYIQAATNAQSLNRYSYVWNNPLNATDPSGYVAAAIVGWTIGKIGASLASKFVLAKFIFSAYQVYNLGKAVLGIAQAYSAWNDGGGGAIWGNLIGGIAKGAAISWGLDSLAGYGSSVEAGSSDMDIKSNVDASGIDPQNISNDVNINKALLDKLETSFERKNGVSRFKLEGKLKAHINPGDFNEADIKDILIQLKEINGKVTNSRGDVSYELDIEFELETDVSKSDFTINLCKVGECSKYHMVNGRFTPIYYSGLSPVGNSSVDKSLNRIAIQYRRRTSTIAHEFGHLMGLKHQANQTGSIMSYAKDRSVLNGSDIPRLFSACRKVK